MTPNADLHVRHGWRSFFWLSVGLSGFNLLTLLFFFPETKYSRSTGSIQVAASPSLASDPHENDKRSSGSVGETKESANNASAVSLVGQGRPSKKQYALWQKPDPRWKSYVLRDTLTPFRIFLYPLVLWAAVTLGGNVNINLFYALNESLVLAAPPYYFSTAAVGYSNFGFMCGGLIGLLTAGPLSDYVAKRSARKNNGIQEAEMRLPALIPFFCTMVIGIVVGGIALQRQWNWPILIVIGFGCAGLTVTSIPTIVIAYCIDCYKPLSGEIMVVATVVKNCCGFGMSYWVPQLAGKDGFITPAMVQFSLAAGPLLLGIPVYFFGKKLRIATKNSYVHKLSEY